MSEIIVSQFGNEVYEVIDIERKGGLLEADSMRIGRHYIPALVMPNVPARLIHHDDYDKALITSRVKDVDLTEGVLTIVTKNTTYKLRRVA